MKVSRTIHGSRARNTSKSLGNCRTKSPRMGAIKPSRNYCGLKRRMQNLPPKLIISVDHQIIDGRNRYRACRELGLPTGPYRMLGDPREPPNEEEIFDFVWSKNLQRRQLTASQRAVLVVERNARHAHCGDRRSWKFADKRWRESYEYLDKARELQEKIAANGGAQDHGEIIRLEKSHERLASEARVSDRTIDDPAKVRDVGTPELFEAVKKGTISAASLVCPGRPCGSALRFPVGAPPSAPLDISRKARRSFMDWFTRSRPRGGWLGGRVTSTWTAF
jgi:hypothetical protein